jgi:hypothetical protein
MVRHIERHLVVVKSSVLFSLCVPEPSVMATFLGSDCAEGQEKKKQD